MPVILDRRRDITLESYETVAWNGAAVRFSPGALERIAESRRAFVDLIDNNPELVIYGVTSGYGQRAYQRFTREERRAHALKPSTAPRTAFGRTLPPRLSRGVAFARLASFVEGHAAVTPALAEGVAAMLDGRPLPNIPAEGNGGAGEILPLSVLFAEIVEDVRLAEKEALALVNGSPASSAMIADAALAARRRHRLAESVFALSIEAILAPMEAYDPALADLWQDPDEAAALQAFNVLLAGAAETRRPYQAPVSWRILPRVLGQARRALRQAEEVAESSLSAVTDNPVFLPPGEAGRKGRILSNGSYHNARAYPALDALTAIYADLALLADRHVSKLLDGKVSLLPDQLLAGEGYLGCLGFTAAGFAEQARRAAGATLLPGSEGGGFAQNDVAVPVFHAWRRHQEAAWCLEASLAVLATVCAQAFRVTARRAPVPLAEILEEVRGFVPPMHEQRALGQEVERLALHWHAGMAPENDGGSSLPGM